MWLSNNSVTCVLCFNNDFHLTSTFCFWFWLWLSSVIFWGEGGGSKNGRKISPRGCTLSYTNGLWWEDITLPWMCSICQVMWGGRACELAYLFLSLETLFLLGILQFPRGNLPAPGDNIFCPVPEQCHHTGPCQQCPLPDSRLQYLFLSQSHPDPTSPFPAGNTGHKGWEEHCQLYCQTQPNQSW